LAGGLNVAVRGSFVKRRRLADAFEVTHFVGIRPRRACELLF
jgi:hypothetical protein